MHTRYVAYREVCTASMTASYNIAVYSAAGASGTRTRLRQPTSNILELLYISIYNDSLHCGGRGRFGQEFFSTRPQYRLLEAGISRSNRFVRAPSSRGGSNAPLPGLSVPYLDDANVDVNADGG